MSDSGSVYDSGDYSGGSSDGSTFSQLFPGLDEMAQSAYGVTNYDNASTGAADPNSFNWNLVPQILQAGVKTYAQVQDINKGNLYPYTGTATGQAGGGYAPPASAGSTTTAAPSGSSWQTIESELTDFHTPVPYIAGGAFVLLLLFMKSARR